MHLSTCFLKSKLVIILSLFFASFHIPHFILNIFNYPSSRNLYCLTYRTSKRICVGRAMCLYYWFCNTEEHCPANLVVIKLFLKLLHRTFYYRGSELCYSAFQENFLEARNYKSRCTFNRLKKYITRKAVAYHNICSSERTSLASMLPIKLIISFSFCSISRR